MENQLQHHLQTISHSLNGILIAMLQAKRRFWGKRPGFDIGDVLHIGVNLGFAGVLYAMVAHWQLVSLALVLVILSKWRVLAVQPRFWLPNIKANLVDVIVGISTVGLMFQAQHSWVAVFWAVLYGLWLLLLKPQGNEAWVGIQAFWAQLLGLSVIFMIPSIVQLPFVVCVLGWLICWGAARHFFGNYEEPHYRALSLAWGVICVQLLWISLHWLQYYQLFDQLIAASGLLISVLAVSLATIYHAFKHDKLQKGYLVENSLCGAALIVLILVTSGWSANL